MRTHPRAHAIAGLMTIGLLTAGAPARAQTDQGIGGTGAPAKSALARDETAYVGEITGFGSIVVNNEHIPYGAETPFFIDGIAAPVTDLREGQIVVAIDRPRAETAERIDIMHEVVGAVDRVDPAARTIGILGQSVQIPEKVDLPELGDRVAVNGFRRPDGMIAARWLDAPMGELDQIVGVLTYARDGSPMVAGLPLKGAPTSLRAGARVAVRGRLTFDGFIADQFAKAPVLPESNAVSKWSAEGYFQRKGRVLHLGDGTTAQLTALSPLRAELPQAEPIVVTLARTPDGTLTAVAIERAGHASSPGKADPAPPAPAPAETVSAKAKAKGHATHGHK